MNSDELDPDKHKEAIEKLLHGKFYPPKTQQAMAAAQRITDRFFPNTTPFQPGQVIAATPAQPSPAPAIRGETFGILAQAIEHFPVEVHIDPNKGVHLNKVVRQWLKDRFGCSTREADVFGIILMEHFFPDIKIANKPERVPGKPASAPSRRI